MITPFDSNRIVPFTQLSDEKSLSTFFDFERYPKLMNDTWGNSIVKRLFFKDEKLALFVDSDGQHLEHKNAFEEFVALMPKRMIFSWVDLNSKLMGSYMQLFMLSQVSMQPGQVYLINVSPSRKVEIAAYNGEVTVQGLLSFVNDYIEKHADYFRIQRMKPDDKETKLETEL